MPLQDFLQVDRPRITRLLLCFTPTFFPPLATMGRRAKTKQAPPEPLAEPRDSAKPSGRRAGKRKADPEPEEGKRPTKKVKETSTKKKGESKGVQDVTKTRGKKGQQSLATSWDDADAEGSSGGWDDMEDDEDMKAHAQCVSQRFLNT